MCESCALCTDLLGAATGPQYIESFLQELFELWTGTTLQEHVPVGACDLGLDPFTLDGLTIDVEKDTLVAGLRRLPDAGNFRVSGENNLEGFAIGRTVRALLPRGKLDTLFAL